MKDTKHLARCDNRLNERCVHISVISRLVISIKVSDCRFGCRRIIFDHSSIARYIRHGNASSQLFMKYFHTAIYTSHHDTWVIFYFVHLARCYFLMVRLLVLYFLFLKTPYFNFNFQIKWTHNSTLIPYITGVAFLLHSRLVPLLYP